MARKKQVGCKDAAAARKFLLNRNDGYHAPGGLTTVAFLCQRRPIQVDRLILKGGLTK